MKSETADSSIFPVDDAGSKLEVGIVLLSGKTEFLKLDAEDAEPEILSGAGDAIRTVEYIACDLRIEKRFVETTHHCRMCNPLLGAGFRIGRRLPVQDRVSFQEQKDAQPLMIGFAS